MLASPLSIVVCEHYIFSTALSIFYFNKFSQRISVKKREPDASDSPRYAPQNNTAIHTIIIHKLCL